LPKGHPVAPVGMLVKVSELNPGAYRMVFMAADGAGRNAPARLLDFDVTE